MHALSVLSSMAAREPLAELSRAFAARRGLSVRSEAAGGVAVAERVRSARGADIVVLAARVIDELIGEGHLLSGSRTDLARSGIAVAVRTGAPRPDIASEDALRQVVVAARSVGYSTGPSGRYLEQLFARWGVLEALRERIVVPPPGTPVASYIAAGRCELGFQQRSELLGAAGVDVLGPLPAAIQDYTTFSAGIAVACGQPALARELLAELSGARSDECWLRYGLEPASRQP